MNTLRACQIVLGAIDEAINNKLCDPKIAMQLEVAADILINAMEEIEDIPNMKARIKLLETECAWLESGTWPKTKSDGSYAIVVKPGQSGEEGKSIALNVKNYLDGEEK